VTVEVGANAHVSQLTSSATTTTTSSTSEVPKVELFGGYSYLRVNPGFDSPGFNFNGGSGSVAYNFMPWLGVVGDFGGYHWSQDGESSNVFTYLFGPKVSLRRGGFTPFAQVLFGGARISDSNSCESSVDRVHREQGTGGGSCSGSSNAFAMALGGGVDWNATPHIGVRLIQAEYLMTRFASNTQNNARISAGVVFRF